MNLVDVKNFAFQHWGSILSLLGLSATIYYARGARNASEAAKISADKARSRLQKLDYYSELSKLIALADELYGLLGQEDWRSVNDRATRLRYACGDLVNIDNENVTEDLRSEIKKLATHFKNIALAADRAIDPEKPDPNVFRYRSIVSGARETLTVLSSTVKREIGREE